MTYEFMVLFGGSLVIISLRRNGRNLAKKKRITRLLKIIALFIEFTVITVGISALVIGLIGYLR